ncbi:MAG: O-antigen ligase family protein [Candidatus Theseobacter exili]|nr:O-antigen ligase family protein [Candidatus Theseobacter exili]
MKTIRFAANNLVYCLLFLLVIISSIFLFLSFKPVLAVIPGLFVLFVLLLISYPNLGYYTVIFLIPFASLCVISAKISYLKVHWIITLVLILLIFIHSLVCDRSLSKLGSNLWPWLLSFFAVNVIASILSSHFTETLPNLFLVFLGCLFFAVNILFISRDGFRKTLPLVLIAGISLSSLTALLGEIFNISIFLSGITEGTRRSTGGTTDPNMLAIMSVFCIPLLFHMFFTTKNKMKRFFVLFLTLINVGALVSTYSRSGAVAFCMTVLLLLFVYKHKFRPVHTGILISATFIIILSVSLFVPASYWKRQKNMTAVRTDRSISRRLAYLKIGLDIFKKHPVIGNGPGTFGQYYSKSAYALHFANIVKGEYRENQFKRAAHNTYLEVLTGTGIIGLFFYLLIIFVSLHNFYSAFKKAMCNNDRQLASIIQAYLVSFIALLFYMLFISYVSGKLLILCLAISSVAYKLTSQNNPEEKDSTAKLI